MILASDLHLAWSNRDDIRRLLAACLDPGENPERVVILAGDLVQSNRPEEYEQAGWLLNELLEGGATVILTPGNHDFGQWPGEKFGTSGRERFRGLLERVFEQDAVIAHRQYDSITELGPALDLPAGEHLLILPGTLERLHHRRQLGRPPEGHCRRGKERMFRDRSHHGGVCLNIPTVIQDLGD